jgi:phosphoribosylaminoimidazole-succinocarboxamide synthase
MKKLITGKVRDVFAADADSLIIVTTDRISAFDVVLPTAIPGKGRALNQISNFWFDFTQGIVPNHLIATKTADMPGGFAEEGRTVQVRRLKMLPFEFIIRGYIFGNMWKAYQAGEPFCGQRITGEYSLAEKLAAPIITPSTKASEGHDVYIPLEELERALGAELAAKICATCLALYEKCYGYALQQGIIIADTKLEFGLDEDGALVLADEIFTPDSSRFWDAAAYKVGESPQSYDKQFVRDWLIEKHLDGVEPAPALPQNIVEETAALYRQCLAKLTGIA